MLISAKIMKRQSEIRQSLAELAGKETPTEDETRSMTLRRIRFILERERA